jgi:hypothetical protein
VAIAKSLLGVTTPGGAERSAAQVVRLMQVSRYGPKRAYKKGGHNRGWRVMQKDQSYFMRRAAEERSAADHASDAAARNAHLELARRYLERVGATQMSEPGERSSA